MPQNCNIMSVFRSTTPLQEFYQINDTILNFVDICVYWGIQLSNNMGCMVTSHLNWDKESQLASQLSEKESEELPGWVSTG